MFYYSICLRGGRFVTERDPKHNKYKGHVYGTFNKHPNAESAIQEYRDLVKNSGEHERSAKEHARSDLNRIPTLNHRKSSLVELVELIKSLIELVEQIKEETKPK